MSTFSSNSFSRFPVSSLDMKVSSASVFVNSYSSTSSHHYHGNTDGTIQALDADEVMDLLITCCLNDSSPLRIDAPNSTRKKTVFSWGDDLNGSEWGLGMDIDAHGNIYVAGTSDTLGNGSWYRDDAGIVLKFSRSGQLLWNITWGTSPVSESLARVAVDNSRGILYVAGRYGAGLGGQMGMEPMNVVLLKVNASNGAILWEWRWKDSDSSPLDLAVDNEGAVYLLTNALWEEGDQNGDGQVDVRDFLVGLVLFKFLPDGTMAWNSTYGVPRGEKLAWMAGVPSMGFDPTKKEIYAAASLLWASGSDPSDFILVKWNASGHVDWATRLWPETEYWDILPNSMALDWVRGLIYTLDDVFYIPPRGGNISSTQTLHVWNATTSELEWEFNYTLEDDLHTSALGGVMAVNQQTGRLYAMIFDTRFESTCGTNAFRINPETGSIEWWEYIKLPSSLSDSPMDSRIESCTALVYDLLVDAETDAVYSLGVIASWTSSIQPVDYVYDIRLVKWEIQPPAQPRNLIATLVTNSRSVTNTLESDIIVESNDDQQAHGDIGVRLQWSPPLDDGDGGICGYVIYRESSDGLARFNMAASPWQPEVTTSLGDINLENVKAIAVLKGGNNTSFTDEAVIAGKTYRYWVAAVNVRGVGNLSTVVSITIPPTGSPPTSNTIAIFIDTIAGALVVATTVVLVLRQRRRRGQHSRRMRRRDGS